MNFGNTREGIEVFVLMSSYFEVISEVNNRIKKKLFIATNMTNIWHLSRRKNSCSTLKSTDSLL